MSDSYHSEGKVCDEKESFKQSDKDVSHFEEELSSHEFMACAKDTADDEGFMRHRGGIKRLVLSTTSSVYAEHTISNPDNDQVKYWYASLKFRNCFYFFLYIIFISKLITHSIAAILQAQIFDDSMNDDLTNIEDAKKFELDIRLPPEYGGEVERIPEDILNHETLNDLDLRAKLISGEVPTVDTMYR